MAEPGVVRIHIHNPNIWQVEQEDEASLKKKEETKIVSQRQQLNEYKSSSSVKYFVLDKQSRVAWGAGEKKTPKEQSTPALERKGGARTEFVLVLLVGKTLTWSHDRNRKSGL